MLLWNSTSLVVFASILSFLFVTTGIIVTNELYAQQNVTGPPLIVEDEFGSQFKSNTSTQTYSDDDVGFSIKYPSDWTIGEEDAQLSTVASFESPNGDASVDVRVFPEGEYNSIKEYGNWFKNYDANTLLAYYRNSTTLLDGKPAFKAIYLTTYNPSIFEDAFGYQSSTSKAMMVATHVPEKKSIFSLIYFADPKDFDVNRSVVEEMFKTFQIGAKGPVIQEED